MKRPFNSMYCARMLDALKAEIAGRWPDERQRKLLKVWKKELKWAMRLEKKRKTS